MNDRPKRERKPTTFFQYRDTSGASTIANAGSTPSRRRSAIETQSTHKIKKEDTESPEQGTSGIRARSRVRGRGRGARGRAGLRGSGRGRSRRRNFTPDADQQPGDAFATIFSDPIDDVGAPHNEDDDPILGGNGHNGFGSPARGARDSLKPLSGRKIPARANVVSKLRTDSDEIIEQWYADPYERVNPNDIAYDQWRLRNLQISLQNQGYSIINSKQMAAWLMKCNGQFMEFDAPVRKSRAKKSRRSAAGTGGNDLNRTVVSDVDLHQGNDDDNNTMGDHIMEDLKQNLRQSEADATFSAFRNAISSRRKDSESTIQESRASTQDTTDSVFFNQSSKAYSAKTGGDAMEIIRGDDVDEEQDQDEDASNTQPKKTQKLSDKQELKNLKRFLNVFNAVYGPRGPPSNPAKFELNHFSQTSTIPILVPKAGLRTQAHYALREVLLPAANPAFFNGLQDLSFHDQEQSTNEDEPTKEFRKVLTEDPDFGLTVIPESQRATEADMKLYYAQFARAKNIVQSRHNSITDKDKDKDPDAQDFEEDLTKEERHSLTKERNRESAKLISEQLCQKVFDWETPLTMQGSVPKSSKDNQMRPGAFALQERHVWKEIRRRQEILDEGGEEAARLLEQEWEDEQLEIRREERRRQNAAVKARKRAAWEVGGREMDGRKRVKFSGWVAEEG